MATKPTGRPRGRPSLPLLSDPDRYIVALAMAKQAAGMTAHRAALFAVMWEIGRDVPPPRPRRGDRKLPEGTVLISREKRTAPGLAATFEGRARTIRRKMNTGRVAAEVTWLVAMSSAFLVTLGPKPSVARYLVPALLSPIGEIAFAESVLLPSIAEREKSASPDFMTNF